MKQTTASIPNNPLSSWCSLWWRSCCLLTQRAADTQMHNAANYFLLKIVWENVDWSVCWWCVLADKRLCVWQMNNLQSCQWPRQASWILAPCPQFTCRTLLTISSCATLSFHSAIHKMCCLILSAHENTEHLGDQLSAGSITPAILKQCKWDVVKN